MKTEILNKLTTPDCRWNYFNVTLQDFKHELDIIVLSNKVPKEIHSIINLCKKLCLYSYFVYEFASIAMERSFMAIETALRMKYHATGNSEIKGVINFYKLLEWAERKKLFGKENPELKDAIRSLRNMFAHPKKQQFHTPFAATDIFRNNVELINFIFDFDI